MRRTLLTLALLLSMLPSCLAQDATATAFASQGYIPYGSYHSGDIDSVNLQSLNLILDIPIVSYKQKGALPNFSLHLMYNSPIWTPLTDWYYCDMSWQSLPVYCNNVYWTLAGGPPNCVQGYGIGFAPVASDSYTVGFCQDTQPDINDDGGVDVYAEQFVVADESEATHGTGSPPGIAIGIYPLGSGSTAGLETADGTGLRVTAQTYSNGNIQVYGNKIIDKYGITYSPVSYGYQRSDPDGNTITPSQSGWIDSVGRSIPYPSPELGCHQYQFPGIDGAGSSTISGTSGGGTTVPIQLCSSIHTISASEFAACQSNVWAGWSTTVGLLDRMILPNGQSYTFTYGTAGEITNIGLPTGGSISYSYEGSIVLCQGIFAVQTRTLNDGSGHSYTWQYSGGFGFTVVTDPAGNDTAHTFVGSMETETDYFQGAYSAPSVSGSCPGLPSGSNLLKSVLKDYMDIGESLDSGYSIPVRTRTVLQGGLVSQTTYQYDGTVSIINSPVNTVPFGNRTQEQNYDYGQCSPGPLLRTINTGYQWQGNNQTNQNYLNANLVAIPSSVQTFDGSGNKKAETDYTYDETSYLDSPTVLGGHVTTATSWLNTGTSPESHTHYNSNGMPSENWDPKGNPTTISYQCAGSLPYQMTNALSQTTTYGYDCNTSLPISVKDPNNAQTTYQYDAMRDLTLVSSPDGGSASVNYNGYSTPLNVTVTRTATPDPSIVSSTLYDGLARPVKTTTPNGATSETVYDGLGRVLSVTNPHYSISGSTDGTSSYTYDALGRTLLQCQPDNTTGNNVPCVAGSSYLQWSYSGPLTEFTDEAGNAWLRGTDGLGRLTNVTEPGGQLTDYGYDALGNLLSVNQLGVSGDAPRTRNFYYDSLSRLISARNPETGNGLACSDAPTGMTWGLCYGYDPNGNVVAKTDARGTTASYNYDALNRLTSKTYSDGTPSSSFHYDETGDWGALGCSAGGVLSGFQQCNTIGRLSQMFNGDWSSGSIYGYDAMGRMTMNSTCTLTQCWATHTDRNFAYDLAGNVTDIWYPRNAGTTQPHVQQTWDAAGRLSKAYTLDGGTETDYLQSATYYPGGQASSLSYGNGAAEFTGLNNRLQTTSITATNLLSSLSNPTATAISGFALMSRNYSYSPSAGLTGCATTGNNGNIYQIADALNPSFWTRKFGYDCLNRLSAAQIGSSAVNYSIDSFGNMSPMSGGTVISTFDPATNRINLPCASVLTPYDAAGNQICDTNQQGADHSYAIDAENRTTGITVLGSGTPFVNYTYGPDGNRVQKTLANGTSTRYQWGNGKVLSEEDQNGNLTDYIYANGQKIADHYSADVAIHIHGTATASGDWTLWTFCCGLAPGPTGYTIKTGDKLTWRQYTTANTWAGVTQGWLWNMGGFDLSSGDFEPTIGLPGGWQYMTADLSRYAGGVFQNFGVNAGSNSGSGDVDAWFADMAIVSSDGTVVPISTRSNPAAPALQYAPYNETNVSFTLDTTTVPPASPGMNLATTYFLNDHLGTTQFELASSGWPMYAGQFDPYGQELPEPIINSSSWPFSYIPAPQIAIDSYKFTGKERDTESGNDYFGARYYASSMGRWLSPDKPFADQHTSNPQSWNLYAYGRNNPLKNVDLNGFKVLQAVLAEAVSKINALPGGNLYLDFAGIQGLHGHPSLNASNNFDGWHSDHSSANSVIIPNNGIVSGFFRALFGLANKDQVDTGKAIVAAAKSSGQDVAFDTYSNGVNAAGQVAQGMSAGDLQSATVVGPNANSPAPVQAMDQADGDATQIYISINDPALALALFGSQSVNDWTSEFGDRVHVTDQPSHNLNQYRGAQGKAPWPGFCPAEFASCN